jgi:hypothetical protein
VRKILLFLGKRRIVGKDHDMDAIMSCKELGAEKARVYLLGLSENKNDEKIADKIEKIGFAFKKKTFR